MTKFNFKSAKLCFRNATNSSRTLCVFSYSTNAILSSCEHERPIGHKFTKPVRNSIKVPRFRGKIKSDMYRNEQLISFCSFSSPRNSAMDYQEINFFKEFIL